MKRLAALAKSDDDAVREMASLVFAIGKAHPGRRKRYRSIKTNQPELWLRMLQEGMVEDWEESSIVDEGDDTAEIEEDEDTGGGDLDLWEGFDFDDLPF
jgi:hypothetical protein